MTLMARIRAARQGDSGAALMMVLMAGAVLTASALVAVNLSLTNLRNAGRDRVATGAMGAAEGGIAEGINFLETKSAGILNCSPTCGPTTLAYKWGNSATPQLLMYPDGGMAEVWIQVIQAFVPPANKVATYKIHSRGTAGNGPGQRTLEQTVTGTPLSIPIGVYATRITVNGTPQTFKESVFSKECIAGRDKMDFGTEPDAYFGIIPAAHSTQWISTNNNCSATNTKNIHRTTACHPLYKWDQDAQGGPVSSPCTPPGGTSRFTQADLDGYGRGLNEDELANLRAQAQAMGQYWTSTSTWTPPNPVTHPHAVMFFDVPANSTLTLQNELDGYTWDGQCTSTPKTLIIVVNNATVGSGGVTLNSNNNISGALFVQKGQLKFNGTATWTGTIWANTIEQWNGSATSQLTSCFLQNLPGGLMSIKSTRFREVDR